MGDGVANPPNGAHRRRVGNGSTSATASDLGDRGGNRMSTKNMIPTAILLGFIGGLIPRYRWWSIPAIGVIWSIMLTLDGDPTMSFVQIWFAGFVLGSINGAVGVIVTSALYGVARLIIPKTRGEAIAALRRQLRPRSNEARLQELTDLRDRGTITDDEYQTKRNKILDSI